MATDQKHLFPRLFAAQLRIVILMVCISHFIQVSFRHRLYPWGTAREFPAEVGRRSYATIDPSNDRLQVKHGKTKRIYERFNDGDKKKRVMVGQETVVIGKDGTLYALTEEGQLVKLSDFEEHADGVTVTANVSHMYSLGPGRPLGGKVTPDGSTLYIGDATLGLTRVRNFEDPTSKVEIVASMVMDDGHPSQILYANDVTVGPISGKIYFTDASDIAPKRVQTRTWDTMYACVLELIRSGATGRVLEYDPETDQVKVLARGFRFANGIGVDKDETFLVFAETLASTIWKYHLTGPKEGTFEKIMDSKDITGYPDGLDCDWSPDSGKCYFVMPKAISPFIKFVYGLPDFLNKMLRNLLLILPKNLLPTAKEYGALVELDPKTGEFTYYQDPNGEDIAALAGVTWHENKVYLGSLSNDYIAVYNL